MSVAKDQIRQIIAENNISSVADVYSLLKDSFKDILQNSWRRNWMQPWDIYGIEVSAEMVSKITDRILLQVKEWQSRPLNPIYTFVFMDCIHYKVREDGRILGRAAYVVLGVWVKGYKDILSIILNSRG